MQKQNIPLAIFLIAVLGLCLMGCLAISLAVRILPNFFRHAPVNNSVQIGSSVPDFELTPLEGLMVRLSQSEGKPILLSIATVSWHRGALTLLRPNDLRISFHKLAFSYKPVLNCFAASESKTFSMEDKDNDKRK